MNANGAFFSENGRKSSQILFKITLDNRKISFHCFSIIARDKKRKKTIVPPAANSAIMHKNEENFSGFKVSRFLFGFTFTQIRGQFKDFRYRIRFLSVNGHFEFEESLRNAYEPSKFWSDVDVTSVAPSSFSTRLHKFFTIHVDLNSSTFTSQFLISSYTPPSHLTPPYVQHTKSQHTSSKIVAYGTGIVMVTSFNSNSSCCNSYSILTSHCPSFSDGQQFTKKQ